MPQVSGRLGSCALCSHPAPVFLTGEVFWTKRASLGVRQALQILEIQVESVESLDILVWHGLYSVSQAKDNHDEKLLFHGSLFDCVSGFQLNGIA
jgi:hypothetical protein